MSRKTEPQKPTIPKPCRQRKMRRTAVTVNKAVARAEVAAMFMNFLGTAE